MLLTRCINEMRLWCNETMWPYVYREPVWYDFVQITTAIMTKPQSDFEPTKTPHSSPVRARYGFFIVSSLEEGDREMKKALLCLVLFSMMTSSNGNIFSVTGLLCGEFTGHRWISRKKASDVELNVFFDLRLNKRWIKQSWSWWFETPSRPLWRRYNVQKPQPDFELTKKPHSSPCGACIVSFLEEGDREMELRRCA